MSGDEYAKAGVDYGVIDPGKLLAQRTALGTAKNLAPHGARELPESRGESAYVFEQGGRYLATVTEALGTKNLVADAVGPLLGRSFYDAIARDTVATIVNDLVTVGARPLCITAYWGAGASEWFENQARLADLVRGWGAACDEAGCAWGGGETQVLKSMIDPGTVVLGGSAVGTIATKEQLLLGSRVQAGDRILLAPAVGIHTNGLTLARNLAARAPNGYLTPVPGDPARRSLGEALLDPTPLYPRLVAALLDGGVALHYAVHVTGHGWRKLMRASQALRYVVESLPEVPPVLAYLVRASGMSVAEAYGTFNMGAGFAFFVAPESAPRALEISRDLGTELSDVGRVEAGPREVVLGPLGLTFQGETLAIR
ncbi:MAG TPA: AIR synthase related protein [Polyangiaceae bacterium]|nr:AIR synthase related protein [Polyangiaceae bacterium]